MKTILISMEGGIIQDIIGIPEDCEIVVWDYDAGEYGDYDDERTIADEEGNEAWMVTWTQA